jgi:SAM-dependent methyltransferase
MIALCPACQVLVTTSPGYELADIPVQSVRLVDSHAEACAFPLGNLALLECENCSLVFNRDFEPATQIWDSHYEETQAHSARFRRYSAGLADRLIERWDLQNKRILEIGCGKGHFLAELCRGGRNQGLGIDPAFVAERGPTDLGSVRYESEVFRTSHLDFKPDLVVCRHTLEHIADPAILLSQLASQPDIAIFIDVPNFDLIARQGAFWDVYYEHCNYFNAHSLAVLLRRFNIACDEIDTDFDEQYLLAFGHTGASIVTPARAAAEPGFAFRTANRMRVWTGQIRQWNQQGKVILLWGGGSRAVAFLSGIGPQAAHSVAGVVDINPNKQGRFLPGSAHPVLAPEQLQQSPPDYIVIMNPSYRDEISAQLAELGVSCELIDVNGIPGLAADL